MSIFKEELSWSEIEKLSDDHKCNFVTFDNLKYTEMLKEALENSVDGYISEIYTEVDAGSGYSLLKGKHLVNRTGIYIVAWTGK